MKQKKKTQSKSELFTFSMLFEEASRKNWQALDSEAHVHLHEIAIK